MGIYSTFQHHCNVKSAHVYFRVQICLYLRYTKATPTTGDRSDQQHLSRLTASWFALIQIWRHVTAPCLLQEVNTRHSCFLLHKTLFNGSIDRISMFVYCLCLSRTQNKKQRWAKIKKNLHQFKCTSYLPSDSSFWSCSLQATKLLWQKQSFYFAEFRRWRSTADTNTDT